MFEKKNGVNNWSKIKQLKNLKISTDSYLKSVSKKNYQQPFFFL